ncbi:MAG TPA: CcmD family protein [Vicinamibacterales bacterium]|nr:CcmD family protein [Vicinamibacterales bacterium]
MTPRRMTWWLLLFTVGVAGMGALVLAQPGQTEFVPVSQLPAGEQLPAARLLVAAYAFVWIAVLAYVWLMWRKLGKVEREISELSSQMAKRRP